MDTKTSLTWKQCLALLKIHCV